MRKPNRMCANQGDNLIRVKEPHRVELVADEFRVKRGRRTRRSSVRVVCIGKISVCQRRRRGIEGVIRWVGKPSISINTAALRRRAQQIHTTRTPRNRRSAYCLYRHNGGQGEDVRKRCAELVFDVGERGN